MLSRFVVHPFLFAVYPIVFLVAQNVEEQVTMATGALALATAVVGAGCTFLVLAALLRSAGRAGALTSLYVFLFFSFGHVAVLSPGGETLLLVVWAVVAVTGTVLVVGVEGDLPATTMSLNVIAIALLLINAVPIATYEVEERADDPPRRREVKLPAAGDVRPEDKRDIYYLIFDRYARDDVLAEQYGFDNRAFLRSLEERGFYVADSVSNHQRTAHSLASSLNMTYLNHLEQRHPASGDYGPVYRMMRDFKVAAFLRSLGYTYHHVGSWWNPTEVVPSADVNHRFRRAVSEFSGVLVESTIWPFFLDLFDLGDEGRIHRGRVRFQFAEVAEIARDPGPTFTFAHFLVPHPPYVFNRDGSRATERDLASRTPEQSYIEQLQYTNDRISELVDTLLAGPDDEDPIIVVQSDEGPHPRRFQREVDTFDWWEASEAELREKLLILNAYHLPGGRDGELYRTISPVNTFRLIFNEYFGTDLRLLEDRSFIWKDSGHLYNFKEVTDLLYRGKLFTQRR